jgi:CRISPR system Cascade subunit CasE
MYLTKTILNKKEVIHFNLFDPYQWHKILWPCFNSKERSYLFRVDNTSNGLIFLIQSIMKPIVQPWGIWQTKDIPKKFYDNDRFFFSLRAYPSVKKSVINEDGSKRNQGVRVPMCDPEKWLSRKGKENGFELENVVINSRKEQKSTKGYQVTVDFDGILSVKDKYQFLNAVTKGIGPSKAYGLGLLLLKICN